MLQQNNRVKKLAFERLEPCAGNPARTVLRGAASSNTVGLPGIYKRIQDEKMQAEEGNKKDEDEQ